MEETKKTKFGNTMYNLILKVGFFLGKVRPIYYLLNLTWGLLLTIAGYFVALAMMISGHKPNSYYGIIYFKTKKSNWGGFSIGMVFVVCSDAPTRTLKHEYGHTYQNAILGPFMLFLVSIPSMIRYWSRENKLKKGIRLETKYDDIWFEGSSTEVGKKITSYIDEKEENKNENK